jgi:hypothetical protein
MKPIYIDSEFKCHTTNPDGTFREVVLSEIAKAFFADKCTTFVEGYRLKPDGETWVREDGRVFSGGEMISPWKDYDELDNAQREYERTILADAENALAILLGGAV